MRYLTTSLAVLTISIWLGGVVTLALLVMAVFMASGLDHESAGRATSAMFIWFGRAQLVVGALALIAVFLGYLQRRGVIPVLLFVMLAIAAVGAVVFSSYFVPRIDALRIAGQSDSGEFKSLHRQSEQLMQGITAVIFIATTMLPAFCRGLLPIAQPRGSSLDA
jgi:uncharacterized membrane-anchored protein